MEFNDLVKRRRIQLGLTMEELGKKVGVSKATVQRWETGEIKNVRRDKIQKIADALQTSPSYLMGWNDDTNSSNYTNNLYKIFEQIISNRDISVYKVSKATGVSQSSLSDWKNGKSIPKINKMIKIADFLGVTTDFLYGNENNDKDSVVQKSKKGFKIPVLGIVPCGIPIEAIEDIVDYEEIPEVMAKQGTYFALIAKGDSMNPAIIDGDVLIVKQVSSVENGKIAIIKVNGDEATCKKVLVDDTGMTIVPLNRDYDPIRFNKSDIEKLPITICGQVVESRRKLL